MERMKNLKRSWVYIFVGVFVIYILVQLYRINFSPVITQKAEEITAYEQITLDGIAIRGEDVLYNTTGGGVIGHLVYDGAHVKKGTNVATVYGSEKDVDLQMEIRKLDERIDGLEEAQSPTSATVSDPQTVDTNVADLISSVIYSRGRGEITTMEDKRDQLELLINIRSLLTNQVINFDDQINQLKTERNALASQMSDKVTDIITPESGYFCTTIDGYEEQITTDGIDSMNVADLQAMLALAPDQAVGATYVVGKVIRDFEWYYAGLVDSSAVENMSIGDSVQMTFPFEEGGQMNGTVYHLSPESGGKCVLVLKGTVMNTDTMSMRHTKCDVILGSYTGIKVPKEALRVVDDEVGVYVLQGTVCKFKEINVLYETDEYVVAEKLDPTVNAQANIQSLQASDDIIVSGKDLYNNKVVK